VAASDAASFAPPSDEADEPASPGWPLDALLDVPPSRWPLDALLDALLDVPPSPKVFPVRAKVLPSVLPQAQKAGTASHASEVRIRSMMASAARSVHRTLDQTKGKMRTGVVCAARRIVV
jgi:hypothetical protein